MNYPVRIVGVDPALSSAAATCITVRGRNSIAIDVIDIPTIGTGIYKRINAVVWHNQLQIWKPDYAFIEKTWAMPLQQFRTADHHARGQDMTSAGQTQRAHGAIEGIVAINVEEQNIYYVLPQTWKKTFALKGGIQNKRKANDLVIEMFPEAMRFYMRAKDHNRAESTLIGLYGALQLRILKFASAA